MKQLKTSDLGEIAAGMSDAILSCVSDKAGINI